VICVSSSRLHAGTLAAGRRQAEASGPGERGRATYVLPCCLPSDASEFPHLNRAEPSLEPVISRLTDEHVAIHHAIEEVDRALVGTFDTGGVDRP